MEGILRGAQENLRKDGALAPVLFLRFRDGDGGVAPLTLPATTEEKEAYFEAIGFSFRQAGRIVEEALFLSESWYVSAEKGERLNTAIAPSRHPRRQEAITIVGRNAERTRHTMVVQTFGRDPHHRPVLGEVEIEEYRDEEDPTELRAVGLVDYLFSPCSPER